MKTLQKEILRVCCEVFDLDLSMDLGLVQMMLMHHNSEMLNRLAEQLEIFTGSNLVHMTVHS